MKPNEKLTDRQLKTIPHILANSTIVRAAKEAEISITQLYAWLAEPEFKAELDRQRNEILEYAVNRLKSGMTKATDTLVALLDSETDAIRRGAANDIIGHVVKFKELQEIEARLETLERLTAKGQV
jgi:hypothetical protein